jgi:hypothetical protein
VEMNLDRRTLLTRGLTAGAGIIATCAVGTSLGRASATADSGTLTTQDLLFQTQSGWCWCSRCRGLFYGPNAERKAGVCTYGGTHDGTGSYGYSVPLNAQQSGTAPLYQTGWKFCGKCWSLAYSTGRCAAGGGHTFDQPITYPYFLFYNNGAPLPHQNGWAYCGQCQVLFYGPQTSATRCPADGGVHGPNATFNYQPLVL